MDFDFPTTFPPKQEWKRMTKVQSVRLQEQTHPANKTRWTDRGPGISGSSSARTFTKLNPRRCKAPRSASRENPRIPL